MKYNIPLSDSSNLLITPYFNRCGPKLTIIHKDPINHWKDFGFERIVNNNKTWIAIGEYRMSKQNKPVFDLASKNKNKLLVSIQVEDVDRNIEILEKAGFEITNSCKFDNEPGGFIHFLDDITYLCSYTSNTSSA